MDTPGFFRGKHYTEYVEQVKELKRVGELENAIHLLLELVRTVERESQATGRGVAPWYYEQLAIIYRKLDDIQSEIEILERYSSQKHAPGVKPPKLLARLEKAKKRLG